MQIHELTKALEQWAPLSWQESYDNAGLILGNPNNEIDKVLLCTDITPSIVKEAVEKGAKLIISHHPAIFQGLKKIRTDSCMGEMLEISLKNGISWYAMHTNLDNALDGVNSYWANKLNLSECRVLQSRANAYSKLEVYIPANDAEKLVKKLSEVGCGEYKNYSSCNWQSLGSGGFIAGEKANPSVGNIGEIHKEDEIKIEMIYPSHAHCLVEQTLRQNHPYEEPAFHFLPILNSFPNIGSGIYGILPQPMSEQDLLNNLKEWMQAPCIKHSGFKNRKIERIAICGGSGSFLQSAALSSTAQVLISSEFKHHDFVNANPDLWLVDVGHFESEQFTKILIKNYLDGKFPSFNSIISEKERNPVCYF